MSYSGNEGAQADEDRDERRRHRIEEIGEGLRLVHLAIVGELGHDLGVYSEVEITGRRRTW